MIWGLSNGQRITAEPGKKSTCDICGQELIAKCGDIKIWHWSHKINSDCDNWGEHETEWHLNWKNEFPKEQQEIVVQWCEKKHRADVKLPNGKVIELQNSPISSDEIGDREIFYDNMIWLINGETLAKGLILKNKNGIITFRWKNPPKSWWFANKEIYIDMSYKTSELIKELDNIKNGKQIFRNVSYEIENDYGDGYHWESSREDITKLTKKKIEEEINLLNKNIFNIKKIYKNIPCGGWGISLSKEEFLKKVKNGENRTTN